MSNFRKSSSLEVSSVFKLRCAPSRRACVCSMKRSLDGAGALERKACKVRPAGGGG